MDRGGDNGVGSDEVGIVKERDFEVGVAGALADAVAVAVDGHAAADHEVDGPQLVDGERGACAAAACIVAASAGGTVSAAGSRR